MRFLSLLVILLTVPVVADENATTKVTGTVTIPKDVGDFAKRTLEIRLYEYDPRIADKAADLVEKVDIKDSPTPKEPTRRKTSPSVPKASSTRCGRTT